jgi:hypothetical protein
MAGIADYRSHVQQVLENYGRHQPADDDVEMQVITDTVRDHYQLVCVGWYGQRRIYGCVLHIDIKGGKVWIQHDGTEVGIANELVALGVPKDSIVLGFHAPYKRPFTGYAVH